MPLTKEQLLRIQSAFRPHSPIDDVASFFGRESELARVREALSEPGLHVIVYGEPGCGKTSLANVATQGVQLLKVFCEQNADFNQILRDIALCLQTKNPAQLLYDAAKDTITTNGITLPLAQMTGSNLLSILPNGDPLCVILDELDRVRDSTAIESLAELVKNVATNRPNLTFIMVGVAQTAGAVLRGHGSNLRNIREVQLDRMVETELRGILHHGEQVLGITFSNEVSTEILQLCDGMPYYLHLLAKHSARAAIEVGAPLVELDDLVRGTVAAASDADQQLRAAYEHAILSGKGSRIYQRILWAMANLAPKANTVADISVAANRIATTESDLAVTPQAIGSALKRLASNEKRCIVMKQIAGVYSFSSPLMKGFIRLVRYQP